MASRNSRSYSTSEVLLLLEDEECLDEAVNLIDSADLEGESEDEDSPQGNGFLEDGSTLLVPSEYLAPGGLEILQTIEPTTPCFCKILNYLKSALMTQLSSTQVTTS